MTLKRNPPSRILNGQLRGQVAVDFSRGSNYIKIEICPYQSG